MHIWLIYLRISGQNPAVQNNTNELRALNFLKEKNSSSSQICMDDSYLFTASFTSHISLVTFLFIYLFRVIQL